jgi:hypothetical protein
MPEVTKSLTQPGPVVRLCEAVHGCFLGLWMGALVMIAFGAPATFITLRGLEPALPQYAPFEGPHYLIAGGHVVRRLFAICDTIQIISVIAVITSFAVIASASTAGRRVLIVRGVLLSGLVLVLLYWMVLLDPGLSETLDGYWRAAAAGDNPRALHLRDRYEAGHRLESRLFAMTAALVLGMLITSFISVSQGGKSAQRNA